VFGTANLSALARYSPLTYLTPDDPPFLLVHGAEDETVPVDQSRRFATALENAGVPERLIVVAHARHGLAGSGGTPKPSPAEIQSDLVTFFVDHLR
jgi:dipeptidyl aminopeptidase/acylaminoacyl peptidase